MYILINEQQIGVVDKPTVTRSKYDGTDTFKAIIPKENLTAAEIEELCAYIRENAPVIELYDNDEKVQTFDGFSLYPVYAPSKDNTVWYLTIENESELKYQYGLLKDRAEKLEKENATLTQTVQTQTQALTEHANVINAQGETIMAQAEQVATLNETIASQAGEIELLNDTLLAVIMG